MTTSTKTILIIIGLVVLGGAWYALSPLLRNIEVQDESPILTTTSSNESGTSSPRILAQGNFIPSAHDVQGKALLIESEGKKIVRFEDFETINGPDVRIYLSADLKAKDYVELSKIKATKGNVNYDVPVEVDTTKYNKVLVWCQDFSVLFSYAELQ